MKNQPYALMSEVDFVGVNSIDESTIGVTGSTFTISPVSGTWGLWLGGEMINKGEESIALTEAIGLVFIYYNSDGVLSQSTDPWDIAAVAAPIAIAYWDGTQWWLGEERHAARNTVARLHHKMMHLSIGSRYDRNGGLGGTFDNTSFTITAGSTFDEDIRNSMTEKTECRLLYRNASNQAVCQLAVTTPYAVNAGALQYDNGSGTLQNVGASQHVVNWIYKTNDPDYPIYIIVGQATYNTVALARDSAQVLPPNIDTREWVLLYSVIYKNVGGTPTYIEATDYRNAASLPGGQIVAIPASNVTVTPEGNITETNVQSALEGLDVRITALEP